MHGHTTDERIARSLRRGLTAAAAVCAALTLVGWIIVRPTGDVTARVPADRFAQLYDARVHSIAVQPCADHEGSCRFLSLRLLDGPDAGRTITVELVEGEGFLAQPGQDVVVAHYSNPEAVEAGVQYQLVDRDRKPALLWLAALFAVVVVALGRWRGLAALVGLAASVLVLVSLVLPAILAGRPPIAVALVGAATIAFIALYTAHGFRTQTTVALLGTLASLALTAMLGILFTDLAQLTGLASEEAAVLSLENVRIDMRGIFLAGLVIGALGAIDDMTVTQTSAVWELRAADSSFSRRALFRSAMRIGRDHVASTVNTLVLAYAGASLALMLLFVLSERALAQVANGEIVAVEIVRTLVGSIGLVASVPITTGLAVLAAGTSGPQADD